MFTFANIVDLTLRCLGVIVFFVPDVLLSGGADQHSLHGSRGLRVWRPASPCRPAARQCTLQVLRAACPGANHRALGAGGSQQGTPVLRLRAGPSCGTAAGALEGLECRVGVLHCSNALILHLDLKTDRDKLGVASYMSPLHTHLTHGPRGMMLQHTLEAIAPKQQRCPYETTLS